MALTESMLVGFASTVWMRVLEQGRELGWLGCER